MTEEWSESPAVGGASEPLEIKLFGRWSSSDVQVSDISLTVSAIKRRHIKGFDTKKLMNI